MGKARPQAAALDTGALIAFERRDARTITTPDESRVRFEPDEYGGYEEQEGHEERHVSPG
jgi:hypothetical protein